MSRLLFLFGWFACVGGCATYGPVRAPNLPNPLPVPAGNYETMWDQIVDVVDDDFNITNEQRVRPAGDVLTVGRIDTSPTTGATVFEPWRTDAVNRYERLHGTFQTVRRRAIVQVVPLGDVYQVEVTVYKELENLGTAEYSTAGAATFRNDDSLIRIDEPVGAQPLSQGWIPLGRDCALEQKILARISARLGSAAVPGMSFESTLPPDSSPVGPENVPMSPTPQPLLPPGAEALPPGATRP